MAEKCHCKRIALMAATIVFIVMILYEPYIYIICHSKSPFCRWPIGKVSHSKTPEAPGVSSTTASSIISTSYESTVNTPSTGDRMAEGVTVDSSSVCSSELCNRYSQYIVDNMDPTADPCEDFYQFACGGFIKSHPVRNRYELIDHLTLKRARIYDSLDQMISKSRGNGLYSIIRSLYKSCASETADRKEEFVKLLARLFDDTRDDKKSRYDNWSNLLALNLDNVLSIKPSVDQTSMDQKVIHALLTGHNYHLPISKSSYTQFIQESFAYFFNSRSLRTYRDLSERIVEFEQEFAKALDSEYSSPIFGTWTDMSQTFIDKLSLELVTPFDSVQKPFSHIARKYGANGVLMGYFKWVVIRELGFLSGEKFRQIEATYLPKYHLQSRCKNMLLNYTSDLIFKLYIQQTSIADHYESIQLLKNETSAIFHDLVEEKTWIDEDTKELMFDKLRHLKLDIGSPGWNLTDAFLFDKYEPLLRLISQNPQVPFFTLFLKAAHIFTKYKFIDFRSQRIHGIDQDRFLEADLSYYQKKNVITITASYLDETKYHSALPKYVRYASIGFDLAHEVTHGYIAESGEHDLHGYRQSDLIYMTSDVVARSDCLIHLYNNTVDPVTNLSLNGVKTLTENTADVTALKIVTQLYEQVPPEQELSLPHWQAFIPSQMFFIAFANNWCANIGIDKLKQLIETDHCSSCHVPDKYRVNIPLYNSPSFRRVFKCKNINEPTCEVW